MTGKKTSLSIDSIISSFGRSALHLELKKSGKGAVSVIHGVISINGYNSEEIELLSHSGRVLIFGERMEISVLENRTVEIYGRITEVKLSYGKA